MPSKLRMGVGMASGAMMLCTTGSIWFLCEVRAAGLRLASCSGSAFVGTCGISRKGGDVSFLYEWPTITPDWLVVLLDFGETPSPGDRCAACAALPAPN